MQYLVYFICMYVDTWWPHYEIVIKGKDIP